MAKIRIGIVGARRGASHNAVWQAHPEVEMAAICDVRVDRARQVADKWQITRVYDSFEQLLSDERINAVYIATPDHTRGGMNIQALQAGKHVLTEIPMATSLSECEQIVQLSRRHNLKVQMGNEVRWAPYVQTVRDLPIPKRG